MDFFAMESRKERQMPLVEVKGFEWVTGNFIVTDTGYILGSREPRNVLAGNTLRGVLILSAKDSAGTYRHINIARAVYGAFGEYPITDSDTLYRKDGNIQNNSIENLVLNDVKQTNGWREAYERNKLRTTSSVAKRCALGGPDGKWYLFSSIGQGMSWLRRSGFTASTKNNRLSENARHNTNLRNQNPQLNKRSCGVQKNYGFTAYLFDELSDKNKLFITNRLQNK